MIRSILLVAVTVSVFHQCRGKTTSNLDLAIQLIEMARDNYPICAKWMPMDCEDVLLSGQNESGIYEVWPRSRVMKCPIKVYCDMDTDGGGWTVIQRRVGETTRPKDFFYQDWNSYKEGFGNIEEEFWLGNDNIYALSNQRLYSVRFDLTDFEATELYALYDDFWIDDEEHQYTLHIKGYSGYAGDSMSEVHNNQKFSTKDRDNDNNPEGSCAQTYKGGWWYNKCHSANLNGLNHNGEHHADGMIWHSWKEYNESLESTEIKIRSKDFWTK